MLASAAYWTEKTSSPARFPYEVGTANNLQMNLPIPVATNRTFVAYQNSAGGQTPGPMFLTNMVIWSTTDPRYGEEGYWPTYHSAASFGGGKYYVCGGVGPNANLSGIYGIAGHNGLSIVMGYMWPSNSWPNGEGYSFNRQAGFSVYDPVADTWQSASWQPADLNGYCIKNATDPPYGTYVSRKPTLGQGTWIGANQAFSFDWDGDGVDEIFMHGGYPQWDGYCAVFDPNRGVNGEWTTTASANNFSSGLKAQMYGGAVRVGSNVYCIGGNYWGPDGATHMQVYDLAMNTWQTYQNVFTNQLRFFGCAAVGNKIYMFSGEQSPNLTYSPYVYALDVTSPETISNGVKIVGQVVVPVRWPSMISWKGVLYIVGGMNAAGWPTNVFQVFNPATEATVVSAETLPVNAYAASCAVSPSGTFYFGGALRMVDPVSGWLVNSSRLWSGPMPEQDIFVAPNFLNFWQVTNNLILRIDNATGAAIACTNTPLQDWLSVVPSTVLVPGGGAVYCTVTVNRAAFSGPTNGAVRVTWGSGSAYVPVTVDTPRPVADVVPASTITLQPRTKSFVLGNSGAVPMYFTNTSADAFVTAISPSVGTLAPGESTSVSFTVTAAAPRPSVGTIAIAFNSYNGLPATFTINNYPADYYVAVSGDNGNNGLSPATAWRNIAFGVTNIPNGSADEGPITLHVGAGTYAGESTDRSGTNWIIDLSNRRFINLIGAGAEQSILTRGTKNWLISFGRDTYAEYPVIKLFNCEHVRVSGFTVLGDDPPAYTDGAGEGAGAPDILATVGILGGNGVRVDHMYLNGMYTGMIYNAALSNWVDSWESWWYFGMCVDGVIGPSNALIDHVLVRGFRHAVMNNSYPFRDDVANIHRVYIDHCTFIEGLCVSESVAAVTVKCGTGDSSWYSPAFFVFNSIIGDYPWAAFPGASEGYGLQSSALGTTGGDYGLNSISNQFWSCGVPVPGAAWWNDQVYYNDDPDPFDNYTNEVPQFSTVGGLPYSTELETAYGTRDVGWNVIPEPAALLVALLALACGRRR
jgi:hypothetical protein